MPPPAPPRTLRTVATLLQEAQLGFITLTTMQIVTSAAEAQSTRKHVY